MNTTAGRLENAPTEFYPQPTVKHHAKLDAALASFKRTLARNPDFAEVYEWLGLIVLMRHTPQQAVAYADLYVANDQDPNFLFQNNGEGHFLEVALISGVCYNDMGKEEVGNGYRFR